MPYIEPVPAAGRYALSKFFLSPDFDTDGDWRLGACVYSAPTGRCPYGNGYDPDLAELHRADRPQSMLALFHPTRLLTDPCGNDPAPTIGPDDSFLHWIRSQPALHVSDPIQRGFAHVDATQWYVTVGATESAGPTDAGTPCPLNDPASVAIKPYEMTPLALSAGQSIRMYSLTKPSDVFVFLITPNQEEFALVETPAEDLLNTLHFP